MEKTFAVACREYFGFRPGEGLTDFMKELKALTPEDREYFRREFVKVGIVVKE